MAKKVKRRSQSRVSDLFFGLEHEFIIIFGGGFVVLVILFSLMS